MLYYCLKSVIGSLTIQHGLETAGCGPNTVDLAETSEIGPSSAFGAQIPSFTLSLLSLFPLVISLHSFPSYFICIHFSRISLHSFPSSFFVYWSIICLYHVLRVGPYCPDKFPEAFVLKKTQTVETMGIVFDKLRKTLLTLIVSSAREIEVNLRTVFIDL